MMNEPKQPEDQPAPEQDESGGKRRDPTGSAPNGVPSEAKEESAKGTPTDDRQETETTADPDKHTSKG